PGPAVQAPATQNCPAWQSPTTPQPTQLPALQTPSVRCASLVQEGSGEQVPSTQTPPGDCDSERQNTQAPPSQTNPPRQWESAPQVARGTHSPASQTSHGPQPSPTTQRTQRPSWQ